MSNTNSNKQNNLVMSFRQKYPEGRIAVNVSQNNGCVMARARIYPNFNDEDRCFLSEITVAKNISDNNDFQDLITEVQEQAIALAIQNAGITSESSKTSDERVLFAIRKEDVPSLNSIKLSETDFGELYIPRKRYNSIMQKAQERSQIEYFG